MEQTPGEGQGVPSAGPAPRAAEALPVAEIQRKDPQGGSHKGQPVAKWSFRSATTSLGGAAQSKEQTMIHQQGQAGENW